MKSTTLLALTASALSLPGLQATVRADSPPPETTLSYRASNYQEDNIDRAKLLTGSVERYEIDVHQLQLIKPIAGKYLLTVTGSHESMSGASPWYAIPRFDGSGGAVIVMSGATIHEERSDASTAIRRYLDNGTVGVNLGYSNENDYRALSGGIDAEKHFNDNLTTLAAGVSFSTDDINPSDAAKFNRIQDASKRSKSAFIAVTQILNANALVQSGLSFTRLSGYLSDPYKLFDIRPGSRSQVAWTTSYRQFVPEVDAAMHIDYRYYHDDFGINSHTVDIDWFQNVGRNWQLVPGLRYYSQSAADFFTPASVFGGTEATTADFRLSAYGAVSARVKAQVRLGDFTLSLSGERYRADEKLSAFDEPTSPALVSFTRWSMGIDYRY